MTTFPRCPITDCTGTFHTHTSKRGNPYRRCDACGAFDGARTLTAAEKAQKKADKAAKKARKTKAQIREEKRLEQRQRELEVKQLPVEGWTPGDWFPELKEKTPCQMNLNI